MNYHTQFKIGNTGGPRYPQVCYSRFQVSAAYDLCTEFVIRGYSRILYILATKKT
jgi:hypothetical protein